MKSEQAGRVVAQVFLRSASGRSFRELGELAPPVDLSPYQPPQSAREEVCRTFQKRGFRVFVDDTGFTVSIEGPPSLFARVFGVAERSLRDVSASKTVVLRSPGDVRDLVEEIVLLPSPELFGYDSD